MVELNEVDEVETAVVAGSDDEESSGGEMADDDDLNAVRSVEVLGRLGALSLRVEMVL